VVFSKDPTVWLDGARPLPIKSNYEFSKVVIDKFGSNVKNNHKFYELSCGLDYKHVTIINYTSSGINKLKASLNDDAGVIIYDRHMFIVQATGHKGSINLMFIFKASGFFLSPVNYKL
jgi:hypothetical protein